MRKLLLPLAVSLCGALQAQQKSNSMKTVVVPAVMHWCSQHCATWTLDKGAPFDKAHYGSEAAGSIVIVEQFTPESVILQRIDYRPYPGRAVLRGRPTPGNSIIPDGTIEWTYHPCCGTGSGKFQASWGADLNAVPGSDQERERLISGNSARKAAPTDGPAGGRGDKSRSYLSSDSLYIYPAKISECEAQECGVWSFSGKEGDAVWPSGARASLSIERFDFDGIVIRRRDEGGHTPGLTAVYTGKVAGNHVDGKVTWYWPGHWAKSPTGTWYGIVSDNDYNMLNLSMPCGSSFHGSPAEAATRGAELVERKEWSRSVCWLRMGAENGDANAQGMLATAFYKGLGVNPDNAQALAWAKKSADRGNYLGERCLSRLYATVPGVPRDLGLAQYWDKKADRDKSVALLAEQQEQDYERGQFERIQNQQRKIQQNKQNQERYQNVATALLLGMFVDMLSDDAQPARSSGNDSTLQRNQSLDRLCRGGDGYACHQLNPLSGPLGQP